MSLDSVEPRHTLHEVAVNAKLTVTSYGNKQEKATGGSLFDLMTGCSDSQVTFIILDMLENKNYHAALFLAAILSERSNNRRRKKELEVLSK